MILVIEPQSLHMKVVKVDVSTYHVTVEQKTNVDISYEE